MTEPDNPQAVIEQHESIKLIKNTKGYNWEIKILEINLERLKEINEVLTREYGSI